MLPILHQSFWRDEAFSVLLSMHSVQDIVSFTIRDVTPPLYYILLHFWILLFGNSEAIIRSLSLLFHFGTVFFAFLLVRRFTHSFFTPLMVGFSVLLNPFLTQYAFEARTYSLLAFLITAAVYFVVEKKYITASIILGLSLFAHNFALFSIIAFMLWWIIVNKKAVFSYDFLKLFVIPSFIFLSWSAILWSQWTKVANGFWITNINSSIFSHSLEVYTRGNLSYPTASLLYIITLIILAFAFSYWVKNSFEKQDKIGILFILLAFFPTLITYAISIFFTPIYHERYLIASLPPFIILVGYSLSNLYISASSILQKIIIAIAILYCFTLFQANEQIVQTTTKPALNWGVKQIVEKAKPGDILIPKDYLNFLEAKYYVALYGKDLPVYTYIPSGIVPWYVGGVLFKKEDVLTQLPKHVRIWQLHPDGGYDLIQNRK